MSFKLKNGQELPALDSNEIISVFEDSYVVDGCEATLGSGSMEVDIAPGGVKVAGQEHNISGETVIIDSGDSDPRKDIIYVDDTGGVDIVKGDPEPAIPNENDRFYTAKPVPASLYSVTGTVLAEVWVDADASSLSSDDIRDRRLFFEIETGDTENLTDTESINAPITNDTELTNFEGSNLTIDSNGDLNAASLEGGLTGVRDASEFSGSDGGEQIQNAVDDLPADGGMVFVPAEGPDTDERWDISSSIVLPSNVELRGVPNATRLYLTDNAECSPIFVGDEENFGDSSLDSASIVREVVVSGFKIDGNKDNQTDFSPYVHGAGVKVFNARDVKVEKVDVDSFYGYSVEVKVSKRVWIEDCTATNMKDDGFTASDINYDNRVTEDVYFIDCYAEGNDDAGFEVDDGPRNVYHVNCLAENNQDGFIVHVHDDTYDAPGGVEEIYHINCKSLDNINNGFLMGANRNYSVRGLYLDNVYSTGNGKSAFTFEGENNPTNVEVDQVRINNFVFEESGLSSDVIDLSMEDVLTDVSITNGHIEASNVSKIIDSSDVDINGLNIADITIRASEDTETGIDIGEDNNYSRNISITGVQVFDCGGNGISITSSEDDVDWTITNCKIVDNGSDSGLTDEERSAIRINGDTSVEDIIVSNNYCAGNGGFGVYHDNEDSNIYLGNQLGNNDAGGFGGTDGSNTEKNANIT